MKPLSRSSRATGPKMRVPLGLFDSGSMSTAALASIRRRCACIESRARRCYRPRSSASHAGSWLGLRLLEDLLHDPVLVFAERARLDDAHPVALARRVILIVHLEPARAANHLAVQWMALQTLDRHDGRLFYLFSGATPHQPLAMFHAHFRPPCVRPAPALAASSRSRRI